MPINVQITISRFCAGVGVGFFPRANEIIEFSSKTQITKVKSIPILGLTISARDYFRVFLIF